MLANQIATWYKQLNFINNAVIQFSNQYFVLQQDLGIQRNVHQNNPFKSNTLQAEGWSVQDDPQSRNQFEASYVFIPSQKAANFPNMFFIVEAAPSNF